VVVTVVLRERPSAAGRLAPPEVRAAQAPLLAQAVLPLAALALALAALAQAAPASHRRSARMACRTFDIRRISPQRSTPRV
jgi:hypothetical protein